MERRTRGIPVARFRTQEAKTRSRSRVREPDYNEQDPEHDLFTLLEDNIALKEKNKELKLEIETQKTTISDIQKRNDQLTKNLEALEAVQSNLEEQIKELNTKHAKAQNERNASEKLRQMKMEELKILSNKLEGLKSRECNAILDPLIGSDALKRKLHKILTDQAMGNEIESIIDADASIGVQITSELVERLVEEFLTLKHTTNTIELQLYEANEKISELLENQQQLNEENDTLRTENTNLTKVAKLLTENMKESVETSKKMESALIKLKHRNDELVAKSRDLTDGQPSPNLSPTTIKENEEFEQIKGEVNQQPRDHNERVVEMQSLMNAAIEKNTNDELKKINLKLEILEDQLRQAVIRAECAESELEKFKRLGVSSTASVTTIQATTTPPPPPPLPERLLYQGCVTVASSSRALKLGTFKDKIAAPNLHKGSTEKIIDNVKQQVQAEAATGLDALVREFKSGRVTLRRNRRNTRTNEALQEMFQVLEVSQKQNRSSKICVDMNI